MLRLTIDGREIQARPGQTVLEAALGAGIAIPHLCHDPRLSPAGACRLCQVHLTDASKAPVLACTTKAAEGMAVISESPELTERRKAILELLLSEHRVACTTCDADGDCLLQDYSYRYGAREDRYPSVAVPAGLPNYTTGHRGLDYDPSKCVRCQRCVRICAEVVRAEAITMRSRALKSVVSTAFDIPLNESSCELCGQCIDTCPTGAMYSRGARGAGRGKDVDRVRTTCPYCGVGCQLELWVSQNKIMKVKGAAGAPNEGSTCVKGRFGLDFVQRPDRLKVPLIRKNGKFEESTWEEALDLVARKLGEVKAKSGPHAIAGLTSACSTNEANYVFQKFFRAGIGTNNVDHGARL